MKDNGMMLSIEKFIHAVLMAASICLPATAVESQPLGGMPNIIFFISDDMGWGDSLVFNPDSQIPMPNLAQLAAEGMRFTDAHAFSSCSPTRYSALTGNYPWRRAVVPTDGYRGGSLIPSSQRTVANVLQDSGYDTAMFGKIHLGGDFYRKGSDEFVTRTEPEDSIDFARGFQNGPLTHGFNHSYVLLRGIQESPYAYFEDDQLVGDPNDLVTWQIGRYGDSLVHNAGIGMPYWDSSQVGPILTQKAIEFIDRHHQQNLTAGTNTPFFVYYAAQSAHSPNTPPNSFHGVPVRGVTGMGTRADMVYEIDVALGKLVEAVQERGLISNTLIIFTSDNGIAVLGQLQFGHDSAGGLRGQKGEVWEAGHRVPFVAKWGDGTAGGSVIPPGTIRNQLIGVQDLTATLAAVVGQELPDDQALDSFNFLPVLRGLANDDAPVRDHLINEGGLVGNSNWATAFREGQWKLIVDLNYNVTGLYDLANDLPEATNLMDDPSQAARIQDMRERLVQLRNAAHTREMPECSDGLDNDDDGWTDYPDDPGCFHPRGVETTRCQDGQDNDIDGLIDFDGGASLDLDDNGFVDVEFNPAQPAVTGPDAQCIGAPWKDQEGTGGRRCGLGSEIILVLPPLWVLRRRKARS